MYTYALVNLEYWTFKSYISVSPGHLLEWMPGYAQLVWRSQHFWKGMQGWTRTILTPSRIVSGHDRKQNVPDTINTMQTVFFNFILLDGLLNGPA